MPGLKTIKSTFSKVFFKFEILFDLNFFLNLRLSSQTEKLKIFFFLKYLITEIPVEPNP